MARGDEKALRPARAGVSRRGVSPSGWGYREAAAFRFFGLEPEGKPYTNGLRFSRRSRCGKARQPSRTQGVHPRLPCPVVRKGSEYFERPMRGNLLGVAGQQPRQKLSPGPGPFPTPSVRKPDSKQRLTSATHAGLVHWLGDRSRSNSPRRGLPNAQGSPYAREITTLPCPRVIVRARYGASSPRLLGAKYRIALHRVHRYRDADRASRSGLCFPAHNIRTSARKDSSIPFFVVYDHALDRSACGLEALHTYV